MSWKQKYYKQIKYYMQYITSSKVYTHTHTEYNHDTVMCCGIIPVYSVKTCHCDWFNKKADWPTAGQDKVRWEDQNKNTRKKKRRVRSLEPVQEKQDEYAILRKGTKPHSRA